MMSPHELAAYIEHSVLQPHARESEVTQACEEARAHRFYAVCVNGGYVPLASSLLEDSGIKVVGTVAFPLGAVDADTKRFETEAAIDNGAHEVDMVIHIGRLKDKQYEVLRREMRDVLEAAEGRTVKVILETCLLTREEKIEACKLADMAGAHFVKTSTGFSTGGATVEDVTLLREHAREHVGIKAAGGIRDTKTAVSLIEAGAARLGTSSSVAIVQGAEG